MASRQSRCFERGRPDLIWMDVQLPVLEDCRGYCQNSGDGWRREVRIVGLSASAFAHEQEDVLAAGMDDFLRKPFRREEIFAVMARQLGVRYSYAEAQPVPSLNPSPIFEADLSTVPQELRDDLESAVIRLESGRIREVIDRMAQYDPRLGEVLSHAAERLQYTRILKALDRSKAPSGTH